MYVCALIQVCVCSKDQKCKRGLLKENLQANLRVSRPTWVFTEYIPLDYLTRNTCYFSLLFCWEGKACSWSLLIGTRDWCMDFGKS